MAETKTCSRCAHKKHTPRLESEKKDLLTRLHRLEGQLVGVEKMIAEDRYCGDVLIQIAAIEKALQKVGYLILETHLATCVSEDIKNEKEGTIKEAMKLIEKLK